MHDDRQHSAPHKLRDLDRRGRLWAVVFALALTLAPLQAFAHIISDWAPSGDPAMIAIRTLAVGTDRTPLTGQPSTSAHYVDDDRHVDHLGPLHKYLMAGPVKVLGLHTGMLLTSVAMISACALLSAWAVYRRLGTYGGTVGAVLIGLTMFTTGASSLMVPLSSNMGGYPLFCAAVLLWCVMRGDLRLLPLAAAVTVFAGQQHLSVVPTVAVLIPLTVGIGAWHWGRNGRWRDDDARRQLGRWTGITALVTLALWSPMLLDELRNNPGNLTQLVELTGDGDRPSLGLGSAFQQLVNVLGWPPLLGRTDLDGLGGTHFLRAPSLLTWVSAAALVAALVALGRRWHTQGRPEHTSVVVMAGSVALAGLLNGSSVLEGVESLRLVFYHWVWPLTFFVVLALALGARDLAAHATPRARRQLSDRSPRLAARLDGRGSPAKPVLAAVALLAVVVPAAVNPLLDRPTNELRHFRTPIERRYVEEVVDQILAERDSIDEPVVLHHRGHRSYASVRASVALYLIDAGMDVRLPVSQRFYVPDNRLAWPGQVESQLVVVHDLTPEGHPYDEGRLVAEVPTVDADELALLHAVTETFDTGPVQLSPTIRDTLDGLPDDWVDAIETGRFRRVYDGDEISTVEQYEQLTLALALDNLHREPTQLFDTDLAQYLLDHPLDEPQVDTDLLNQLVDSDSGSRSAARPLQLRVFVEELEEEKAAPDLAKP